MASYNINTQTLHSAPSHIQFSHFSADKTLRVLSFGLVPSVNNTPLAPDAINDIMNPQRSSWWRILIIAQLLDAWTLVTALEIVCMWIIADFNRFILDSSFQKLHQINCDIIYGHGWSLYLIYLQKSDWIGYVTVQNVKSVCWCCMMPYYDANYR